jgi:hypothetical protein
MDVRERWRARSVVVNRWITTGEVRPNDEICEINVDGVPKIVRASVRCVPTDYLGVFRAFVRVGQEVGPYGSLLAVSSSSTGGDPNTAKLATVARTGLHPRPAYPSIFLSYRKADSEAHAGRLHEVLSSRYGVDNAFMDQFSIRAGEVFPWTIQQAAANCRLMIVLIGPQWFTIQERHGNARLHDYHDFVRREVCAGLDREIPVLPVLVSGAPIPEYMAIDDFEGLEQLQFHELSTRLWKPGVDALMGDIDRHLAQDTAS